METSTAKRPTVPIYEALADRIRQSVRDGRFSAGQLIGSEYELARQEKISRMTVRRASELLVEEGLLERRPGKGLYVRGHGVSTRTVQMIVGNLQWESSAQVARGAQRVSKERGVQMQIYDAHGDSDSDVAVLKQTYSRFFLSPSNRFLISASSAGTSRETTAVRSAGDIWPSDAISPG